MLSLKINDIKITMAHLLLMETFDEFLLEESKVVTFAMFEINGKSFETGTEGCGSMNCMFASIV